MKTLFERYFENLPEWILITTRNRFSKLFWGQTNFKDQSEFRVIKFVLDVRFRNKLSFDFCTFRSNAEFASDCDKNQIKELLWNFMNRKTLCLFLDNRNKFKIFWRSILNSEAYIKGDLRNIVENVKIFWVRVHVTSNEECIEPT